MAAPTVYPSESARAASAGESRFRIRVPIAPARAARVIGLDGRATAVARRLAEHPWAHARFYTGGGPGPDGTGDPLLHALDGTRVPLPAVLDGSDVVVVLATEDGGRDTAAAIGRFCWRHGITTAGVVLGDGFEADDAVSALRPYARVLMLSADESDVFELLTALRV